MHEKHLILLFELSVPITSVWAETARKLSESGYRRIGCTAVIRRHLEKRGSSPHTRWSFAVWCTFFAYPTRSRVIHTRAGCPLRIIQCDSKLPASLVEQGNNPMTAENQVVNEPSNFVSKCDVPSSTQLLSRARIRPHQRQAGERRRQHWGRANWYARAQIEDFNLVR